MTYQGASDGIGEYDGGELWSSPSEYCDPQMWRRYVIRKQTARLVRKAALVAATIVLVVVLT